MPKVMTLGKASKPATLEERLVAGDLQPSVVAKVLPLYEKRDKPEVPNHVKDMAADEGELSRLRYIGRNSRCLHRGHRCSNVDQWITSAAPNWRYRERR